MKMSTKGVMGLIHSEAIVLTRYKDSVGVWTLGVGHTSGAGPPNPATFKGTLKLREVVEMLERDIGQYEDAINAAVTVDLDQCQFDALVHWCFNVGPGAPKRAKLIKSINRGAKSRKTIYAGFMGWLKPRSLKGRRKTEVAMFFGTYPPANCVIYKADKAGNVQWSSGRRVRVDDMLKRQAVTVADLRARGSRNIRQADVAEVVGVGAGGLGAVEVGLDVAERVQDVSTRGAGVWDYVQQFALPVALLVAGVAIVFIAWNWKKLRLNIEQTGEHM